MVVEIEKWASFLDYSYEVSSTGKVVRILKNGRRKFMKPSPFDDSGYLRVTLTKRGVPKTIRVHRMVLMSFAPCEGMESLEINHINGIKTDNRLENLEWVTRKQNAEHAVNLGLYHSLKGEKHSQAKLTEKDVLEIRELSRQGYSGKTLAEKYDLHPAYISLIVLRKRWKHI